MPICYELCGFPANVAIAGMTFASNVFGKNDR